MEPIVRQLEKLYLRLDRLAGGRVSLLINTVIAYDQDDGPLISRSLAYYALFSLFPLILVLISFSGSLLAADDAQLLVLEMVEAVSPEARQVVEANLEQVLAANGTVGVLSLLALLWSASGVFTALYRAVNRAWGNPKSELFWAEKLFGLAVVLIVGLVLIATTIYSTVTSVLEEWSANLLAGQPVAASGANYLASWLSGLVPVIVSVITFIIIYRVVPRDKIGWRDVWLGGLLAGLIWDVARRAYAWYLTYVAQHSLIYGSVGAIIGFLLWAYLSAIILLMGAEFTAQHTHWRRAGRPIEDRPLRTWLEEWTKWKKSDTPLS